jgi:hypothetical protein
MVIKKFSGSMVDRLEEFSIDPPDRAANRTQSP